MNLKKKRQELGLTQGEFWSRIGVTQSGGSRYESGRNIPKAVLILLNLVYGGEGDAVKLLEDLRTRGATP